MNPNPTPTPTNIENQLALNFSELSEWIKETANKTGDFFSEQTPLFIQEYLAWMFWGNVINFGIILTFLIAFSTLFIVCCSRAPENPEKEMNGYGVMVMISFLFITVFSLFFIFSGWPSIKEALKVKIAPRVVLVEKLKELIK